MQTVRRSAPVGQQDQQVGDAYVAVVVEVRRATGISAPRGKQREEVRNTDAAIAVKITLDRIVVIVVSTGAAMIAFMVF